MRSSLLFLLVISFQSSFAAEYRKAPLKDCTKLQAACFDPKTSPNDPYFLANPFFMRAPGNKTVVLVHGLTDSPYTWRDVSISLNQMGYNVYALLLTGHGDKPEGLLNVTGKDWYHDISSMINFALKETGSQKVAVMAFSLGAAMSTLAALPNQKKISSLVLLEPAFKIKDSTGRILCSISTNLTLWFNDHYNHNGPWARNAPGSVPWAYNRMSVQSVCEMVGIGQADRDFASGITIPVFSVVNGTDENIIDSAVVDTMENMNSPLKEIFYLKGTPIDPKMKVPDIKASFPIFTYETVNLRHSDIPYRQDLLRTYKNPLFDEMMGKIKDFFNQVESLNPVK